MSSFLVRHLLGKKYFNKATLLTGDAGLTNQIKWVHILETLDFDQLIHGNELILTTGIQLTDEARFFTFVKKLIEKQVAGLCIELGAHLESIPKSIITLANEAQFPILVFHEVVPFIEITKEIHSALVNQQYQMVKRLEDYAQEINKLTLHARHYEQILMRLYKYLNMHVVFFTNGQPPTIIPNTHREHYEQLRTAYEKDGQSAYFARYDVVILEETYGELCIFSVEQPINEFDLLILDRTVIALSQFLLRSLYIEETQNLESQKFFENWLAGQLEAADITHFLQQQSTRLLDCPYVVVIEKIERTKRDYDLTYYKMSTRPIFEKYGFTVFINETKQALIYILVDIGSKDSKHRIQLALEKIEHLKSASYAEYFNTIFAVGQFVKSYTQVAQSSQTAADTLLIRLQDQTSAYFYEDLYIEQILLQIQRNPAIMDISRNYLQPLVDYDDKHKSQLVATLTAYLQYNGQKNETAEALFIVRQTLYHRLSKIEQLIGDDFMISPKRIMLELMLLATQRTLIK
ncbi:MAG: PucR family transcriptional regulator ligand-binding domain-containing protein [Solibacillus sp.]